MGLLRPDKLVTDSHLSTEGGTHSALVLEELSCSNSSVRPEAFSSSSNTLLPRSPLRSGHGGNAAAFRETEGAEPV